MIKAICLTNSTEFKVIIGQIKNTLFLSKLPQFLSVTEQVLGFIPLFLVWDIKFKFLARAATSEANHKIKRVFTFSKVKLVNSSAAANTDHLITSKRTIASLLFPVTINKHEKQLFPEKVFF